MRIAIGKAHRVAPHIKKGEHFNVYRFSGDGSGICRREGARVAP